MVKHLTLTLLSFLILSCAARKVSVNKTETKTYTDSLSVEKRDSVSVKQNAIFINQYAYEIEVTPIDTSKPLVIGGIEYKNSVIKIKKNGISIIDSSKTIVAKAIENQVKIKSESITKTKDKKIDKKVNYWSYLWLLLIPSVVLILRGTVLK